MTATTMVDTCGKKCEDGDDFHTTWFNLCGYETTVIIYDIEENEKSLKELVTSW